MSSVDLWPMQGNAQHNSYTKLCFYLKHHAVDARSIHGHLLKMGGLLSSVFLCNSLVGTYAAQLMIHDARNLFDQMPLRNEFSWSTMVSAYVQQGNLKEVVLLFKQMLDSADEVQGEDGGGVVPNKFIFGSILKGCARARDLRGGIQFHCSAAKHGVASDTFIASTIVDMYGKCGDVEESWSVFKHITDRNVVTWTAMITCFANHEKQEVRDAAFRLFGDMIRGGVRPAIMTFTSVVKIFDEHKKVGQAKQVHGCLVKFGIEVDEVLGSALIAMYGRCGGLDETVRLSSILRQMDVVSWTSLLVAFVQNGFSLEAMCIVRKMVKEKIRIDPFVITSILGACSSLGALESGEEIHGYAVRNGFVSDVSLGNAMITLYGRCHEIRKAEKVFRLMERRDDVSWTALLTSYVQNEYAEETIYLFLEMVREGLNPPLFSITGAISSCSVMASLSLGEQMHSRVVTMGMDAELSVENSLVTMYGRCGDIAAAASVFRFMTRRDVISWNAIIGAFSQHGFQKEALELFSEMQQDGMEEPDDYTFLGVLVSCGHAGMIDEGCQFFNSMSRVYGLDPKMEHFACMVDLFGRAGRLDEVMEFIGNMPCSPDHLVWEAVLASCMLHGNAGLGKLAAEKILEIAADNTSAYTSLSNIYASMGMWDTKAHVLSRMRNRGIRKEPSRSWIEIKGTVHVFSANDKSHPSTVLIHQKLEELKIKMEGAGYVPDRSYVLQDIEYDQKEMSLLHHSEKLAVAFALIATARGTPIRIMQNLRCCGDCHAAFKLISSIEYRHIVLRDKNRFHHFRHGTCTCKDYW